MSSKGPLAHYVGTEAAKLPTPSLVVDLDRMEANVRRMAEAVSREGLALRPHVKTHKTVELARLQLRHGAVGITAAKLSEAEALSAAGAEDILIAHELVTLDQAGRLLALSERARVRCLVDSIEGAERLSGFACQAGRTLDVMLDVDTGLGRTGVQLGEAGLVGQHIATLRGLTLTGVFSYAGYRPRLPDAERRRGWAHQEAMGAVAVAEELRSCGIPVVDVSVAGSSSAPYAVKVAGVTEVRPGTYVFGDANYARLGINTWESCALGILARVVSRPTGDRAVLDAGTKALGSDAPSVAGAGFGYLPARPGCRVERLWEEHAVVTVGPDGRDLKVADTVTVVPNHACSAVNLFDYWFGLRNGHVEEIVPVIARGCST
jgi:D-serine deaminase-like pyridoxal phosphate-dependent protein